MNRAAQRPSDEGFQGMVGESQKKMSRRDPAPLQ